MVQPTGASVRELEATLRVHSANEKSLEQEVKKLEVQLQTMADEHKEEVEKVEGRLFSINKCVLKYNLGDKNCMFSDGSANPIVRMVGFRPEIAVIANSTIIKDDTLPPGSITISPLETEELNSDTSEAEFHARACTCHNTGSTGCPIHEDD